MPVHNVSLQEAENHLADLIKLAEQGDRVLITRGHGPGIQLVVQSESQPARVEGLHAGQGWISEDFDEPLGNDFWLGEHR